VAPITSRPAAPLAALLVMLIDDVMKAPATSVDFLRADVKSSRAAVAAAAVISNFLQ
jgi:predicted ATPase